MRTHNFLIGVLATSFFLLAIQLFYYGEILWLAFACLSVISLSLLIKGQIHEDDEYFPKDWQDYKATYDDGQYDDSDWTEIAMRNRDAEIKHKSPSIDDDLPF